MWNANPDNDLNNNNVDNDNNGARPVFSLLIIIIIKNNILLTYKGNIEVYNSYLNLSIIAYNKYKLEEEIINKIKNIPSEYYNSINNYLEELINNN